MDLSLYVYLQTMMEYYKNGKLVEKPKLITYNNCLYFYPTDNILLKSGFEITESSTPTNEDIKNQRRIAYKNRADEYFIAYQAYVDLDELEKAKEMKALWLEERKKINEEYPYIEE